MCRHTDGPMPDRAVRGHLGKKIRTMRTTLRAGIALALSALTGWVLLAALAPARLPDALRAGSAVSEAATAAASKDRGGGPNGNPVAVEARSARQSRISSDIRGVGSLQSDETVQIASEIAGRIDEIAFLEGQPIRTGDVIVRLDEALATAEVADAEARLNLARQNSERAKSLARSGSGTERTRDEAVANLQIAIAALELARTRLAKHTLRAPFDGVAGIRNLSAGAYVGIGMPIVNIEKIDTLKVDFKIPELFLTEIRTGQKIDISVDAVPDRVFEGEIYAINPLVDINGRALQIRARLANPELLLRPGLFVRITIKGLGEREITLIPESAIVPRGSDAIVYRIDNGQAIETRVKLGDRINAEVEVVEGLDANATVVTAGQQKLRNGTAVEIVSAGETAAPVTVPTVPDRGAAGGSG
jgi:membrane fusion protein, multidrug efflux system